MNAATTEAKNQVRVLRPIDTTPIYDKAVPVVRRVYYSDSLGRVIQAWDGFKSREAASTFWRMLACKGVEAWLPSGLDGWIPNKPLFGQEVPHNIRARVAECERQYDIEGAGENEGEMWAQLYRASTSSRRVAS